METSKHHGITMILDFLDEVIRKPTVLIGNSVGSLACVIAAAGTSLPCWGSIKPKRPFAAIVGGSKISSKIGAIESLLEKVDYLLLGGGMIFTFYKAQGLSVGSSLVEEDKLDLATTLLAKAKAKGVSLLLPSDVVIANKFAPDANSQ
ncbi:hypothetical protein RIF29_25197 [Crotalaria pallida]|uniref:phosphoglycerate kinase n=1 Tax=Crotalaria pallida TaxID=3830 RepID=A0AAN9ELX6_CROPI